MSAMMDDVWHWFKARPWAIAGGVTLVAGGVWLYYRSASSSAATAPATLPDGTLAYSDPNAQLEAQYGIAQQQLAQQASVDTSQQQLASQQEGDSAALAQAEVAAQVTMAQLAAQSAGSQAATQQAIAALQTQASTVIQAGLNATTLTKDAQDNATAITLGGQSVQIAGLTQQTNLAAIAAQLQGLQNTNATQLAETQTTVAGQVQIASIAGATQVTLGGQQMNAALAQTAAQLAGLKDTDATNLALGQLQAQVTEGQTAAAVAINGQNTTAALTGLESNNATSVSIAQLAEQLGVSQAQETTKQNAANDAVLGQYVSASEEVANHAIAAQTQQTQDLTSVYNSVVSGLNSGVYNKGGSGGANQVTVAGALLGSQQAAATSAAKYASDAVSSVGTDQMIASLGKSAAGVAAVAAA